jgi:PAS domain S-box-containing protein
MEGYVQKAKQPIIEVGYGIAKGDVSFSVGVAAARQALSSIRVHTVAAVLVFVAAVYNPEEVLQGVYEVVGEAPVFGATTAGEIFGVINRGSVCVTILASPYLRVYCGVGVKVSADWRRALDEALDTPVVRPFFYDLEYREQIRRKGRDCFVMLFTPGITNHGSYHGFEILEALKEKSGGAFTVVGGGASDDFLEQNQVLLGQQAYPDSVLVAMFETELQFGLSLTHGFRSTDARAIVTAVKDEEVLTLDGEVAADAYSRLVGVPKTEMGGIHPAHVGGATFGISDTLGQHTVNLVDSITPRGGIILSRPVSVGTALTRMEPARDSLVQAGAEGIRSAVIRGGIRDIALCLICYCSFRPRLLGEFTEQEFAGMREVLAGKPLVGFCCCGEIGVAADSVSRFNTSSIACLVLGGQLSRIARITIESNGLLAKLEAQSNVLARINEDLLKEIAERKKIEAALRESETKLKDFAHAAPDISMIIDEDGCYVEVFESGYQHLNRPKEELNGCTLRQRFPAKCADLILRQIRQTIASGTPQCQIYEIEIDGEQRFFEGRTAPMSFTVNGKRMVAAVALNVTERRKTERMLEFAYELRRKSDFLNNIINGNTKVDGRMIATVKTFGIDFSLPLSCCLLTVDKLVQAAAESGEATADIQMLDQIIELLSRDSDYLVWDCRDRIGVLCQTKDMDCDWKRSRQFALQLQSKITNYDPGLAIKIGVSNSHIGPDSISEAYRQAWSALVAARCRNDADQIISHFYEIGIAQLLVELGGKKSTNVFINEKLGKIFEYDRKKGTNLFDTLEEVLQSSSLREAAQKMFIHYKTMAFRKQRIETILGVSIDDFETKLSLAAAVKLYRLSGSKDYPYWI